MLNLLMNDQGNFSHQLRRIQTSASAGHAGGARPPELSDWLQYWNDADSVEGNLRKLQHWLQRARREN